MKGDLRVSFGIAACDCPKGTRLSMGAFQDWRSVRDAWMNDQYTEQVFYSTAQQPHLTTDQTITPEQLEQRAQRARAMLERTGSRSGWHTVKDSTPSRLTE